MNIRQEYLRLRRIGWPAQDAWHAARANVAFDELELADRVRLRVEPDEQCTIEDALGVEPGTPAYREEVVMRADEGVWGLIAEVRCTCCGSWTHVNSVWGFVGDDFVDSGYDSELRAEAVETAREQA